MLDLVQMSRGLVLLAQRQAAERATDEELWMVRAHHERRVAALRAGDGEGVELAALAFHTAILRASRNQELQRVYPMVFPRLERVFRVAYPEWLGEAGVNLDAAILAAMEARDAVAVVAVSGRSWDALEAGIRVRATELELSAAAAELERSAAAAAATDPESAAASPRGGSSP
jgi:DNA-binding FadR family transcriptional regulator